jgi:hypothetical protein
MDLERINIAHILDTLYTLYTLTVEMECPDGAPGMPGTMVVLLFENIILFPEMR